MKEVTPEKVKITTEYITLGQLIKFVGLIDNGALAKIFITNNKCFVNGTICSQRGKKLYPGFLISINGSLFFEITK